MYSHPFFDSLPSPETPSNPEGKTSGIDARFIANCPVYAAVLFIEALVAGIFSSDLLWT